jgi:hypothetical protein
MRPFFNGTKIERKCLLNADHIGIVKFATREALGYISFRAGLACCLQKIRQREEESPHDRKAVLAREGVGRPFADHQSASLLC